MKNHDEESFNREIGRRIKNRRKTLGLSAPQFAQLLNISPQQLYKYENGQDRINAMRICEIARYLNVEVSYLLKIDSATSAPINPTVTSLANESMPFAILDDKETKDLVRYFIALGDVRTRLAFVDLIKSVSKYCVKITTSQPIRKI